MRTMAIPASGLYIAIPYVVRRTQYDRLSQQQPSFLTRIALWILLHIFYCRSAAK